MSQNIKNKLGTENRVEIAKGAIGFGLTDEPPLDTL
jgi:DNA-binding CsgD family transcriptional regulator